MQRINGHAQSPLQLARVDDSVDPAFDESMAIEVIERGSAVHCFSAYEGDIVVLGSDGVFDNLFDWEICAICNEMLPSPSGKFAPVERALLAQVARRIVQECHSKTEMGLVGYQDTPIGKGGKVDDTCCVVGEVVEWTHAHGEAWAKVRREKWWSGVMNSFTCGDVTCHEGESDEELVEKVRNYPSNPNASFSTYVGSFSEYGQSFSSIPDWGGRFSVSDYGGSFASTARLSAGVVRQPTKLTKRRIGDLRSVQDDEDGGQECHIL